MNSQKKKTNRFFIWFLIIVIAVWWFNNYTLKAAIFEIESDKIDTPIRIVAVSDMHYEKIGISRKAIKEKIKAQNPDIICVLGDMYSRKGIFDEASENSKKAVEFMDSLTEISPVYFVPGEHDYEPEYLAAIEMSDVNLMSYKEEFVTVKDNKLRILGINNVNFSNTFDLENEFVKPDGEVYNILLAHIPMPEFYEKFGADLTLCGDTHGGIIRLPYVGAFNVNGKWFPELKSDAEVYDKGLFGYGDGKYIGITSGLGSFPAPVRFMNRPEVLVIDVI
ncbi:MAG: metallophosphoesterase [Ruminococcus sp.]|nr:metallophosphoesterase [Ruminococcus sp.]